jgi:anaerobic selenocysteine-containing dehydrogenase
MKGYVRISEIGNAVAVKYRASLLGIVPLEEKDFGEIRYSLKDAERLIGYRPRAYAHHIKYYEALEFILNDDKLRYDTEYASKIMNLPEKKILKMLEEYNKTGCFVVASKL